MSRRALPKIDPSLDYQAYLLTFEQLPDPWDNADIFGRQAPLEIDVGCGKGMFLQRAAKGHPDQNFLGIEVSGKYARFAASKLARQELANGRVIHGDAWRVFRERIPADHVTAVHVYFPDPWWKKRHRRRRVMNERFLGDVVRVLVPGGILHFWTDVEEYFQATLELIADVTSLEGPIAVAEPEALHDMDYRTHFERRSRLEQLPVYRAQFRKVGS